ncbi:metal ABC transporter ATP-binding protein [Alloprevotella tannerae]|uniref:metal ABC transporter ATP-binding protein n=1 Tax=Alloprevotella tannerae TaxID=76122 RepID=UPI0028EEBF35|nr:metal ABC transporter ATP-binding protein [Alloprevotella tannerae]
MNLVSLSGVSFAFDGQVVLENVNIAIKPHDFIVLRGTNGGGKTTLLRLLAGLLRPTKGEIRRASGLRLGYLPQYRKIDRRFPLRVYDVVRSGLQNRKKLLSRFSPDADDRVREALHQLAVEQLAARPISDLSGGQWQRVLLARAIVSRPDLLLLDEPDTHLDAAGKSFLYELLLRLQDDCAIVLVSHDETLPFSNVWQVSNHNIQPENGY